MLAPAERVMKSYSLSHLSDRVLLRDLATHVAHERATTALVLAHIAEVDARGAYRASAYPSMYAYCVGQLRFSEEAAFKRIHAARTAREFPQIFPALADGRLHLSAVILLAPHLTPKNAADLLTGAEGKTKSEIERLLAERFPQPDLAERLEAIPGQLNVGAGGPARETVLPPIAEDAQHAPGRVEAERSLMAPRSPGRYGLQLTIGEGLHEKLSRAQDLLGCSKLEEVLDRAVDALIEKLEKRKLGKTERPRNGPRRESKNPRHIPAHVRRAVHERDGGRCTFVADTGHRCESRRHLEFDHVEPIARGGKSTTSNLRLRCRAHNQYAAEQTYGADFMKAKRQTAQEEAARRRVEEVVPWLQALRIPSSRAREAAERCGPMPGVSLEDRVKAALRQFGPRDVQLGHAMPAT